MGPSGQAQLLQRPVPLFAQRRRRGASLCRSFESTAGADGDGQMADNTCHFGINSFFADNGLADGYETRLYFVRPLRALRRPSLEGC